MKKVLNIILCICILFGTLNVNVIAAEYNTEDVLCSAFVVMKGKRECLVKNYCAELSLLPIEENGRIYIGVKDLEKWGASVWCSEKFVTIIYGAYTIEMTPGSNCYYINGEERREEPFIKVSGDRILADIEAYAEVTELGYIKYNDMGVIFRGVEIDENICDDIYEKAASLKKAEIMAEFYVSPNGSDSGTGSKSNPFKTINRAKTYVKNMIRSGMTGDIYVYVEGGTYKENLEFSNADGGEGQYRVIYKGYNGLPKITLGEKISGWEPFSGNIHRAYVGAERDINLLTENDSLQRKARFPDDGYLYAADGVDSKQKFFYSGDIPLVEDKTRMEAYLWGGGGNAWSADTIGVSELDYENKKILLKENASYNMSVGSRFFLQGAIEFLDSPGEFFCDGEYLYYYPVKLPIDEQEIAVAGTGSIISFSGSSAANPLRNIVISGFEINTSDVTVDAVVIKNAGNIEIENCKIKNTGRNAVSIKEYAVANRISGCEISSIGAAGIIMQNTQDGSDTFIMNGKQNEILNCDIHSFGKIDGDASGISMNTGYNLVKNCIIYDGNRMGITISSNRPGMLLGKTVEGVIIDRENVRRVTHSQDNFVMFCDMFDLMRDSQDGGAVYSWGGDYRNVIAYNHIHDTCSPFSFAFGIYIDDGADRFIIKNNIVDNMNSYKEGQIHAGIFTKGVGNKVYNNFVVNNKDALYAFMTQTMVEEPCDNLEYSKNIVYNSGSAVYCHKAYSENRMKFAEKNIYYSDEGLYGISGINGIDDLYEWQDYMGGNFEKHTLIGENPLFYDVQYSDYRLCYNSPAYKNSITDIDMGEIGLTAGYKFGNKIPSGRVYLSTDDRRIRGAAVSLDTGDEIELNAYARDEQNGFRYNLDNEEYIVENIDVARVENGKLLGLSPGTTKLTVIGANSQITYDVAVGDRINKIVLEGDSKIYAGRKEQLNIYAATEFGEIKKDLGDIKYKSSDNSVARVDEKGEVSGIREGTAVITVSAFEDGKTYTSEFTVTVYSPLIFYEDFEGDIEKRWRINNKAAILADGEFFLDGVQSMAIGKSTGTADFTGDMSGFGNYVYEFWMYDDMNVGTGILELAGTDKYGNKASVNFGIKENAYGGGYYLGNQTETTAVKRENGWHRVILDMTTDYKISIYIDGAVTAIKNGTHNLKNIESFKIYNAWYKGGSEWKYNFDSFRIWRDMEACMTGIFAAGDVELVNLSNPQESAGPGDRLKITAEIENMTMEKKQAVIILAIYESEKLKEVKCGEKLQVEANSKAYPEIEFRVDDDYKNYVYKVFLWDGLENMKPIAGEEVKIFL